MAHAGAHCEARDLYERVSRTDQEGRRAVRALRDLEGPVLCCFHLISRRSMRFVLWSVRTNRQAGPYDYSNGPEARLLLPVALRTALAASSVSRDSCATRRSGRGDYRLAASAFSLWRRRKE